MILKSPASRRLPALAMACLLGVALPALPAAAKEKTKTKPAAQSQETAVDFSVFIPTVESVGSNVDDAVIIDILSGDLADNADALAGLTATSITVPEIELTVTGTDNGDDFAATATFTDLVLTDVVDGVAGTVSLGEIAMLSDEADFTFGTISAAQFDIGGVLGIYGLVDDTSDVGMQTIYTDFRAEGATVSSEEVDCTIGPVSGAEFRAKPLPVSFVEFVALAEQLDDDPEDFDPALMARLASIYADLLTSFETSEVSVGAMACDGIDEEDKPFTFGLDSITVGAMTEGVYPSVSMDGFRFDMENEGSLDLDNFTLKPMNLLPLIETLRSVPEDVDAQWFDANARRLFPEMEGLSLSGFAIDVPDPETKGNRIQAEVGSFDLSLADYVNSVPTDTDMVATNIRGTIPENTGDEGIDQLRALGLTDFDLGFRVAAAWDEATDTIDIEEISLTGVDLATVTLVGKIANATNDLFATDTDVALEAAMGIAVQSLDLDIVDAGLSDLIIAAVAEDQGVEPDQLRPIYGDLAKGTVISLLAGMADASKLGDAVSAFIAGKAKTLTIGIDAKEAPGIGMADFMAAETNPASLLDKVNVTAVAK